MNEIYGLMCRVEYKEQSKDDEKYFSEKTFTDKQEAARYGEEFAKQCCADGLIGEGGTATILLVTLKEPEKQQ